MIIHGITITVPGLSIAAIILITFLGIIQRKFLNQEAILTFSAAALFVVMMRFFVFELYFKEWSTTPLASIYYATSALLFGLALYLIKIVQPRSDLMRHLIYICFGMVILNCIGLGLFLWGLPPMHYNAAFLVAYLWTIYMIIGKGNVASGIRDGGSERDTVVSGVRPELDMGFSSKRQA